LDVTTFFTEPRLPIVAGKGGVGKTTLSGALALTAAGAGLDVLVLGVGGGNELAGLFGHAPLGFEETILRPADRRSGCGAIRARALSADEALVDYLVGHGLRRLARTMVDTGVVEVIARGAPGMKDILVLGKVKQLERSGGADVLVVDAPASGHAITFLRSPRGLLDAVRLGPINAQARDVLELLTDGSRCQVLLATLPEETPVNELVETAYSLEEDVGVKLGPVLVNGRYPDLDLPDAAAARRLVADLPERAELLAAAEFRRQRAELQAAQARRLAAALPLPQLVTSFRFTPSLDRDDLAGLAGDLRDGIERLA
jgi:anion-transporting  ArsA/GET3 family ATPase